MIEIIHGVACACVRARFIRARGAAWNTLLRRVAKRCGAIALSILLTCKSIAQRCETDRKTLEEPCLFTYASYIRTQMHND